MSIIKVRMNPAAQLALWGFDFDIKRSETAYDLVLMRDYQVIARASAPRSGGPMNMEDVRKRARNGLFGETTGVHKALEQFVVLAREILAAESSAKPGA